MIAIAIFTLVICCIGVEGHHGVESLPGDAKRETTGCSVLFFPKSSGTNSSGTNSSGQTAVDKQQWTNSSGTNSSGQTPMHPHFPPPFPPPPPLKRYEVIHIWGFSDDPEQTQYWIQWQEAREACQDVGGDLAEPSTWKEQFKIMMAIDKFPVGKWSSYWIGIKKKTADASSGLGGSNETRTTTADAFWVSGKKLELDSGLKFTTYSQWDNKLRLNRCGAINYAGIDEARCDGGLLGYVCEFTNEFASPICIQ